MKGTGTLRSIGTAVCAALAGISLAYGIVALTEGYARGTGSNLAFAGLFGVSAVLLWRRAGWRCAGVAFGLLMVALVVLYIVLVELHTHRVWG